MKYIVILFILCSLSQVCIAENQPFVSEEWDPRSDYMIESAIQGQIFKIKGNKYKAKKSCKDFQQGQWVRFVANNPNQCFDNIIYNRETGQTCEVFCMTHK